MEFVQECQCIQWKFFLPIKSTQWKFSCNKEKVEPCKLGLGLLAYLHAAQPSKYLKPLIINFYSHSILQQEIAI